MLRRQTSLIVANTAVGAVLGFAALKVFAVQTGPAADVLLGQLAFALGLAGVFSIALDLGFGVAHIRRVSEGRDLAAATGTYARLKVVLAAGFVLAAALVAWAAVGLGVLQDVSAGAIVLAALYYAFQSLRTVFTATYDGRREFAKTQAALLAENAVRLPLMVLFSVAFAGAVLGQGGLAAWVAGAGAWFGELMRARSAELLVGVYALAALSSMLVAAAFFRRGYPVGRFDPGVVRDYWGFSRHIFLAAAVGYLYVSVDKVVIGAFWEPSNTGQYFGAQRFSDLIGTVPLAVYTVLLPSLSGFYARGNAAEARAALESAVRHVSLIVVPLVAYTIAMAGPLLSLVLTGFFEQAVPTLRLLAMFALFAALMQPYVGALHALGRPDLTARAAITATAINVGLDLLLVPPAGTFGLPLPGLAEVGAAAATLVAIAVQFLMLRRAVHRLEGPVPWHHTAKHVLAGVASGAVLWALAPPVDQAAWYVMLGLAALGAAVYAAVLWAMRELTRHDIEMYLHALDPAAMGRYITEEVRARGPGGAGGKGPRD